MPPLARILFQGLWCLADCAGRLEDRPRRIKAEVLPYDDCDVDDLLSQLGDAGFIVRYSIDGVRLIEVPTFRKHQRITGKESENESLYPPPDSPGKQRGNNGETTETTGREGRGKETEGSGARDAAPMFPDFAEIPTVEEVIARGSVSLIDEDTCRRFFAYHSENNSWLNRWNRPIDWPKKLVRWWQEDKVRGPRKNGNGHSSPKVDHLKGIREV